MKFKTIISSVLILWSFMSMGQSLVNSKSSLIKVRIENFQIKASDCGVTLNTSLYKANIIRSYGEGEMVLLYIQCAETMRYLSPELELYVEEYIPKPEDVFDFTDLEAIDKKILPKYRVVSVKTGVLIEN